MVNQNRRDLDHNSTSNSADKGKKKAGPKVWTKDEDMMLLNMVQSMRMPIKWSVVAQQMQERTGKQCRERYVNHLNPRLKVTDWNPVEDATIFHLYNTAGSHWAKMSKMIPGRTDNGIKNRFHNLRRQLEREDEHRLRLSKAEDFPEEIRLECIREFPKHLWGKNDELWDIHRGLPVLAAQSVLGGGISRNAGRFGPFRTPDIAAGESDLCVRCGFLIPSVHTGAEVCTKTGWCVSCTRVPPHISGALLRECLNLRRCDDKEFRPLVESWTDLFHITDIVTKKEEGEGQ
jgi:Myb-like DNA-binding domain